MSEKAENGLVEIDRVLDEAGAHIGNEHKRYSRAERIEWLASVIKGQQAIIDRERSRTARNRAIAEACGWRFEQIEVLGMADVLVIPPNWPPDAMAYTGPVPDYCNDLNAMHAAESTLAREEQFEYHNHLFDLLPCDENHGSAVGDLPDIMTPSGFTMLHATARQRAEAFLRTIGKWRERKRRL